MAVGAKFTTARLRLIFALFFVVLAVPTLVLVRQAFSQLELDSFRQHQLLAEGLAANFDSTLRQAVQAENARSFGDYSFVLPVGAAQANSVQRSQLSAFPVVASMPGLLGYFQVDADGEFSTPLLPSDELDSDEYGVAADERTERMVLQDRIRAVLAENRVVRGRADSDRPAVRARLARAPREEIAADNLAESPAQELTEELATLGVASSAVVPPDADRLEVAGQAVFDQLSPDPATPRPASNAAPGQAPQRTVAELAFAVPPAGVRAAAEGAAADSAEIDAVAEFAEAGAALAERELRQQVPPASAENTGEASDAADGTPPPGRRIDIFDTELEPFAFGLLDTGHFVLFRNAWRDGARSIQGALIEQTPFLASLIAGPFRDSGLAATTRLSLSYAGRELAAAGLADDAAAQGTVLYRARLSPPLAELELQLSTSGLPPGPAYPLLVWLSLVLAAVLPAGFVLLYRFSVKQMELARQQQDFVSAVSHELKTPLTSIRMYGEMLKSGWAAEAKKQTYYDFIFNESERLSRLIENVLQLARVTHRDTRLDLVEHTVAELLDLARSKVTSQLEHAGFALRVNCDAQLHASRLLVDADSFAQIAINLVDNAVKFSGQAGQQAVEVGMRRQPEGRLAFTVRDFGPGVPRAKMRRLFELFYRPDNELTRGTAGTGIGLALVKQLAEAMHAKVDVRNCEPGAEFIVSFPAVPSAGAAA
jgi:signal transduction histidine kinase